MIRIGDVELDKDAKEAARKWQAGEDDGDGIRHFTAADGKRREGIFD